MVFSALYRVQQEECTSQEPLCLRITKFALDEVSEAGKLLNTNVKEVIEVIVGLLKDRIEEVGSEPAAKKKRVAAIIGGQ